MKIFYYLILPLVAIIYLSSCSTTKYVPENEYLLRNNKVHVDTDVKGSEKGELKEQLSLLVGQGINTYTFNLFPFKLWLYNARFKKYSEDSLNYQITNNSVEKPVLLDTNTLELAKRNMSNHLHNLGYFDHDISTDIRTKGKKAYVHYNIITGDRLIIDEKSYLVSDTNIQKIILSDAKNSLFKTNTYYSNIIAAEERSRLTLLLKQNGYYHSGAENIKFELDTLNASYGVYKDRSNVTLLDRLIKTNNLKTKINIKTIIDINRSPIEFYPSHIGNVVVVLNMSDTLDMQPIYKTANNNTDSPNIYIFNGNNKYINDEILKSKISLRPGALYSIDLYDKTLRQLTDLGVFQYVRIRFAPKVDSTTHTATLNCVIYLSPNKKFDFSTNVETTGGDIYTLGTAANVSIINKNVLKGANQLSFTGLYGIEFDGKFKDLKLFSQTVGVNGVFAMPKIWQPFSDHLFDKSNYTKTSISAGMNLMNRTRFFFLRNFNTSIQYEWNRPNYKHWKFKPIFINTMSLSNISPEFQNRLDSIPAIKNAYEQNFIEGQSIEFIKSPPRNARNNQYYLRLALEESGTVLGIINSFAPIKNYSQYVRFDFDFKRYFYYPSSSWIFRFHGGVGLPYGNSQSLPYIKQYFVGGAYSIRGWRPRTLGPGGYYNEDIIDNASNLFVDYSGDIKLECNAEYRFTIARLFANGVSINGAVFADAGNIWMARKDSHLVDGSFEFSKLYNDIAISSGAGLRIDFGGFLVLRLDYAIQMKKPYLTKDYGWNIDNIQLLNADWRRHNSNLNIAIGYPF